ncbi:MAG: biopolymer transporter ExbD [Myxococcales bacterium]|nr:biopolymer transporter ExbD [Myxococcales bacterium]
MSMNLGGDNELNAEINVTPMVDVMLVLLVIFMVTAPMMNTGVDVDLPPVSAQPLDDPQGKLVLSIDRTNKLMLGKTPIVWADLPAKLSTNERLKREGALYIEADKTLPYGVVVTAMAVARGAGVAKVMMLTDPGNQIDLAQLDLGVPAGAPQ